MIEITREIATKVLACVDAGLVHGVGRPVPGQMCVEAAVCYALGLPHGDDPKCVAPTLRRLKIEPCTPEVAQMQLMFDFSFCRVISIVSAQKQVLSSESPMKTSLSLATRASAVS